MMTSMTDLSRNSHLLPLLPSDPNHLFRNKYTRGWRNTSILEDSLNKKMIPRYLWIGMRIKPNSTSYLSAHLNNLANRAMNQGWQINVLGNMEQLHFMESYWPGTSVLWAYKSINPELGNAACDIWRYAVLYAMGGFYLDDDSYIANSLENVISPNDSIIMTVEKNRFGDNCFVDNFHLSHHAMKTKYSNFTDWHNLFGNRALVSWGIFAAPQQIAMLRMLENVVESIRAEYLRSPVTWLLNTDQRWKIVMCSTGPSMLTATVRALFVETTINDSMKQLLKIRVVNQDFKEYGGVFKVNQRINGHYNIDNNHYMVTMQKRYIPLLSTYVPFNITHLENKVVTPGGKKIYLVKNASVHLFPNFDTLIALNFTMKDVIFIGNWTEFSSISEGDRLKLSGVG